MINFTDQLKMPADNKQFTRSEIALKTSTDH